MIDLDRELAPSLMNLVSKLMKLLSSGSPAALSTIKNLPFINLFLLDGAMPIREIANLIAALYTSSFEKLNFLKNSIVLLRRANWLMFILSYLSKFYLPDLLWIVYVFSIMLLFG